MVGIPVELVEAGAAEEAVQAYANRLAAEHNTVVHFALHKPDRGGRNHHAHVLYPGRHVAGLTFSRKRDREQDNPTGGGPDLVARHKSIWSEVCRDRGLELDWTSEDPGHHLGPALCAVKRARLVEETRETIRETVAVSTPGEAAPDRRTLQAVAEIATRVNDGLTVTEMLEREREEALHGRPAPRPVPAPSPFRPEVVPAAGAHEVLPPVKRPPEVLPPATAAPEVLPPRRETPRVLPPARRPEVLPPARQPAEVVPPREVAADVVAARVEEEHPRETAATWSEVERHIELQRRQTLAHQCARAAARKLGAAAGKRERAKPAQPPAPAGRIRRIADWLLSRARKVLEYLGLESAAVPASRTGPRPGLRPPRRRRGHRGRSPPCGSATGRAGPPPPGTGRSSKTSRRSRSRRRWRGTSASAASMSGGGCSRGCSRQTISPGAGRTRSRCRARWPRRARSARPRRSMRRTTPPASRGGTGPAFDAERIAERSLKAVDKVRQTLRYRRFAGERRKQTLEDDAVRQACGDDAQRLDREMRAERRQWQRHWDVLVRHDALLREERESRAEHAPRLQERARLSMPARDRARPGPEPTR